MKPDFFKKLVKLFKENDLHITEVDPSFSFEPVNTFRLVGRPNPEYICDAVFRITVRGRCTSEDMQKAAKRFEKYLNNMPSCADSLI